MLSCDSPASSHGISLIPNNRPDIGNPNIVQQHIKFFVLIFIDVAQEMPFLIQQCDPGLCALCIIASQLECWYPFLYIKPLVWVLYGGSM